MLSDYSKWINQNKETLLDSWECGFYKETIIDQKSYEDFVSLAWSLECQAK